ncbi:MAG: TRAP transporter large permease subunit, partial [Candidatus Thiodiazotropha sp.]
MDPLILGILASVCLVVLLLTGMPVAFALGVTAVLFLVIHNGPATFTIVADTLFSSLDEFALLSIPMFLVMGSAIAASRAGADLY